MQKLKFKKKNKILIISVFFSISIVTGSIVFFTNYKRNVQHAISSENFENNNSKDKDISLAVSMNEKKNEDKQMSIEKIPTIRQKDKNYINFSNWNNSCIPTLVVINKDNPIPSDYKANIIDYKNIKINSVIKNDLDNMIDDAAKKNIKIYPSSGYRSIERQTVLFNNQVSKYKKQSFNSTDAEIKAATVVARPKTSEHHTGLAIDFNGVKDDFYKTKEYTWLMENAPKYGFILRYPQNKTDITNVIYEPWHFRYVGKDYAKSISESGMCYEEYIESIMKK